MRSKSSLIRPAGLIALCLGAALAAGCSNMRSGSSTGSMGASGSSGAYGSGTSEKIDSNSPGGRPRSGPGTVTPSGTTGGDGGSSSGGSGGSGGSGQ